MFRPHPAPKIHHPCGVADCECPVTKMYLSKILPAYNFENQTDEYKCGPVAVINALTYCDRPAGKALRRSAIKSLGTQERHTDGSAGTKSEHMAALVKTLWPRSQHFVGRAACISATRAETAAAAFIVLYSWKDSKNKQHYHYTFVYRSSNKDSNTFYSVNDGSDTEIANTLEVFKLIYFSIESTLPFRCPQIWVIATTV